MSPILERCAIFFLATMAACSNNPPDSMGPAQQILILADPSDWLSLEVPIREIFEKKLYTPQPEKIFQIQRGNVEDFEQRKFHRRKNLLIVAPLNVDHPTAQFLKTLLSTDVKTAVLAGTSSISWKEDVWAKDQLLMIASGKNLSNLVENLRLEADRLYRKVEDVRNKRISELIYLYGEQEGLSAQLAQTHGWTFRVPFGFRILIDHPDSGFVTLAKENPSRWVFVYWEFGVPLDHLTESWCIQKRDEITLRFFDGDRIVNSEVEVYQSEFAGKIAITLQGLWENRKTWAGGPFKSYAFLDITQNRFFFVDVGVFSPNKKKEPYLRQIDLMAQTFELKNLLPIGSTLQ